MVTEIRKTNIGKLLNIEKVGSEGAVKARISYRPTRRRLNQKKASVPLVVPTRTKRKWGSGRGSRGQTFSRREKGSDSGSTHQSALISDRG